MKKASRVFYLLGMIAIILAVSTTSTPQQVANGDPPFAIGGLLVCSGLGIIFLAIGWGLPRVAGALRTRRRVKSVADDHWPHSRIRKV